MPSSKELENKKPPSDSTNTYALAGEVEFNAYEKELASRLDRIVAERAYLLTQDSVEGAYRIGPGDVVLVSVFGFDDLKTKAEISPDGTATFPMVGEVSLAGENIQQARTTLTSRYSRFIKAPKVELGVESYQSNRVSVIGEVFKPGVFPLKRSGQLLTEFLAEAGGKKESAGSRIVLMPAPSRNKGAPDSGYTSGIDIDLEDLMGSTNRPPILLPLVSGDTVIVSAAGTYEVDGEVEKPGSFKLAGRTSVIGAVASAGGFTYSANVNAVELIREIGEGRKALISLDLEEIGLRGGRDVRLRNGDLVRVPSESGRFMRRQVVEVLNGIFRGIGIQARP